MERNDQTVSFMKLVFIVVFLHTFYHTFEIHSKIILIYDK